MIEREQVYKSTPGTNRTSTRSIFNEMLYKQETTPPTFKYCSIFTREMLYFPKETYRVCLNKRV